MGGDLSLAGSCGRAATRRVSHSCLGSGPPRRKRRGPGPHECHGGLAQAELMGGSPSRGSPVGGGVGVERCVV